MSDKGVALCSEAVVNHYGVTFSCLGASLEKLNNKQTQLTKAVQKEGEKLNEERGMHKVEQMISITGIYKNKLDKIKDDMVAISARSARLRQRASKLQEEKQLESMEREVRRDTNRIRESQLIAKPAANFTSSNLH